MTSDATQRPDPHGGRSPVAVVLDSGYGRYDMETRVLAPFGFSVIENDCKGDAAAVAQAVREADAVLVRESPITAEAIAGMQRCRAIVRYGVGIDNIDLKAAARRGIYVANVPDYGTEDVSDHALAMMLALIRRIPSRDRDVRAGAWNVSRAEPIRRTGGRVLGIAGFGRIGQSFFRKAKAFNFERVLIHDQSAAEAPDGAELVSADALVAGADIISLHLPLIPATDKFISRERIACMRPGAMVVNTSRGGLIDEEALADALHEGRLGGAALDVFRTEPPATDSRLFSAPNTVFTDHTAWYSEESVAELQSKAAQEIFRVFSGEKPKHWVNAWS